MPGGISRWTATISKSMPVYATCEKCRCKYVFVVSARGKGEGRGIAFDRDGTRQEAIDMAMLEANKRILRQPAACPDCGWYQKNMVAELRRRYKSWMRLLGLALLAAVGGFAGLAFIIGSGQPDDSGNVLMRPLPLALAAIVAVAGGALLCARYDLAKRFDPNASYPQLRPATRNEPASVRTPEYQQQVDAEIAAAAAVSGRVWYYTTTDGQRGPVTRDALAAALRSGALPPTAWVWTEGLPDWLPAARLVERPRKEP